MQKKCSGTPNINLYGYATSPFVQKVHAVLSYKKLDFQAIYVNPINNQPLEQCAQKIGGGRQVPVLNIDDEWRRESTELCLWLEQSFPEQPLLPDNLASIEAIQNICDWVDKRLIFASFLAIQQLRNPLKLLLVGWRLGGVVKTTSGITTIKKYAWPLVLKKARFIQQMVECSDWQGNLHELLRDNREQLENYLKSNDYLGGYQQPSIADCCAFGPLAHAYMLGSPMVDYYFQVTLIDTWFKRMCQHFQQPFGMLPEKHQRRSLPSMA